MSTRWRRRMGDSAHRSTQAGEDGSPPRPSPYISTPPIPLARVRMILQSHEEASLFNYLYSAIGTL